MSSSIIRNFYLFIILKINLYYYVSVTNQAMPKYINLIDMKYHISNISNRIK